METLFRQDKRNKANEVRIGVLFSQEKDRREATSLKWSHFEHGEELKASLPLVSSQSQKSRYPKKGHLH
jgi:hypothetical protein